jgi:BASS family bile acid:Na+ symporter
VITGFLGGSVEYVVASVLLTNVSMAMLVPFVLPRIVGTSMDISTWEVLQSVLFVVFVPLLLARLFTYIPRKAQTFIRRGKPLSFWVWLTSLFLISSKSSYFITHELSISGMMLAKIALISLLICIINFGVGALVGGQHHKREASQSLGQKNNSFSVWLALTFISPVVVLGPTFYIIYHNLYNSFQLYAFEKVRLNGTPQTRARH